MSVQTQQQARDALDPPRVNTAPADEQTEEGNDGDTPERAEKEPEEAWVIAQEFCGCMAGHGNEHRC